MADNNNDNNNSNINNSSSLIPESLFDAFFREATKALLQLDCGKELEQQAAAVDTLSSTTLKEMRQRLLNIQTSCLQRVITQEGPEFTFQQVRNELRNLGSSSSATSDSLKHLMETMNEAARLTLCRLVLYAEYTIEVATDQDNDRKLVDGSLMNPEEPPLERDTLLEFIALCTNVLKLHSVKQHLQDGSIPVFDTLDNSKNTTKRFPSERLQDIQSKLARAVGIHPNHMTKSLQRIFVDKLEPYASDEELCDQFERLISLTNITLTNASLYASNKQFSDIQNGGCTRVVSVNYSEHVVDDPEAFIAMNDNNNNNTDKSTPGVAPSRQTMAAATTTNNDNGNESSSIKNSHQYQQLQMAKQAAVLQQELLAELLAVSEHERNLKLEQAKQMSLDFEQKVLALPPGPERIAYLRNIDPKTQRYMAMYKLWQNMLAQNGGQPPKLASK